MNSQSVSQPHPSAYMYDVPHKAVHLHSYTIVPAGCNSIIDRLGTNGIHSLQ